MQLNTPSDNNDIWSVVWSASIINICTSLLWCIDETIISPLINNKEYLQHAWHNGNMIIYCSTEQIIYSTELSWIDFKDLLILCLTILQHREPDKAD